MSGSHPAHARYRILLLPVVAALSFLLGSCMDVDLGPRSEGTVGTENAGRVVGSIKGGGDTGGRIPAYAVRLVELGSQVRLVDSTSSDSSGGFFFGVHPNGRYRVEVWRNGQFHGATDFDIRGDVGNLLVVLVEGVIQLELDLSEIGNVDSVFVDYPTNKGTLIGGKWVVQTSRSSGFILHAHLGGSNGRWEEWMCQEDAGRQKWFNLADSRALDFRASIDSGAFLLTGNTVALWNFDSIQEGKVADRSGFGNDLRLAPSGTDLVVSPHGKALSQASDVPSTTSADTLPESLQWLTTGFITYELRLKIDRIDPKGMVVAGSDGGPRIWIMPGRQILVESILMDDEQNVSWGALVSVVKQVPLGRWFDLSVSVDGSRNDIYAWIDGVAVPLYTRDKWPANVFLAQDPSGPFSVGAIDIDRRLAHFQLDEMRISDNLVHGPGLPRSEGLVDTAYSTDSSEGLGILLQNAGVRFDSGSSAHLVGRDSATGTVGAFVWKPTLPAAVLGKRIIFAQIVIWDADTGRVERKKSFDLFEVRSEWSRTDQGTAWHDGVGWSGMISGSPDASAPLQENSTGGLIFDATRLVQGWVDDPASNHGVLLRATDESAPGIRIQGPGRFDDRGRRMCVDIRYR